MSTVTLLDSIVQPTVAVSSHINKNLLSVAVANTADLTNFLKINLVNPSLVPVDDGTAVLLKSDGSNLDSFCDIEGGVGCGKITSKLRPDPYPAAGSDEELRKRTVSGQIYVPSDVFNATSKHERAFRIVVMYSGTGSYLEVRSNAATVADSWVDLSVTVEVPPTATEAFIRLYNGTTVTTDGVRFRHLKVEAGSTNTGWIAPTSNTQDSQNILSKWENESNITAEDASPAQTILNGSANGSQYSRLLTSKVSKLTQMNTFAPNVANCCEDGTVNGFQHNSAAAISPSTDWYLQGSKSLKIDFDASTTGYCCWFNNIQASKDYTFRKVVHGTKGTKIRVEIGDINGDSGAWRLYKSLKYVLSGGNDTITIPYTSITGAATMYTIIYCEDTVARTVYVDSNINGPGNFPNLLDANVATGTNTLKTTTGFGSWEAAISSVIEQAYEGTNSLKVIPNGANRGMFFRQIVPVGGGQYSLISVLKGKSGSKISISIEQADELNNQNRGPLSVGELTFDGTWQVIKWTGTLDNATTKVTPTFYAEDANAYSYFFGAASFHPGSEQKLEPSLVWSEGQIATVIQDDTLSASLTPENTNIYGVTVKVKARALINHVSQNVNTCGATLNNLTGFSKVNGDETLTTSGGVLTISTPGTATNEGVSWHATGLTVGKQYTVQINANIPDGAQVALVNQSTGESASWTIVNGIGMYATRELSFTANATDNILKLQTTVTHAWSINIKSITVVRDTTGMQLKAFATNPTVTLDTAFVNTASGSNNIKRTSTTALTEEYAWITLGSNKDQWGWKLLRELILDANFGTAIQFKTSSSEDAEALVQVDDVQLDVTYYYPESDLQATIKTDHQTLFVGEVALIEYLIVNNGPCPATNVVATIALPASFTMQYSTLVKGTYANGTWTIPTLANGETAKLHILAEATAEGTTTASVTSSVDDPTTINNSASYTFNIQTITATTDSNIGFWYDGGYSQQYGIPYCSEIVRNMRGETTDAVMDISRRDGTIPVGQDDSARKIDVTFPIIGTDYEDLRTKVKNIAGWLKTNRIGNNHPETAELIFDDDPTHKYNVYPQGEIPAPQEFSKVAATVSFYLPLPYAEKRWLVLSGPAGNNEGTVATYPTVTLIANAVTELKVINQQTQQEIAINHTFGGGEKVVIDCDKRTVYADDVDLRSQVEFTSSFFKLWPGVFEITSVGGSISAVAYKELSY